MSNTQNHNQIFINGQPVDQITHTSSEKSFKFLGIHIDENLTWKYHIKHIAKKISNENYIINKVKTF